MSFFQSLKATWQVVLNFFPRWWSTAVLGVLIAFGVSVLIGIAQRLKDLFWPF